MNVCFEFLIISVNWEVNFSCLRFVLARNKALMKRFDQLFFINSAIFIAGSYVGFIMLLLLHIDFLSENVMFSAKSREVNIQISMLPKVMTCS